MRCLSKYGFHILASYLLCGLATMAHAANPAWVGVWHGTIGKLPVTLCFYEDGDGSYYYGTHSSDLLLQPKANGLWIERPPRDDKPSGYLRMQLLNDQWQGSWSNPAGSKSLPLHLTRAVDSMDKKSGCESRLYQQTRLDHQKIVTSKPKFFAKKPYRTLVADGVGGLELLAPLSSGTTKVNELLRNGFELDRLEYFNCTAQSRTPEDNQYDITMDISMWTTSWLVVMFSSESYCNSPHPNSSSFGLIYNIETGQKTRAEEWFKPTVWKSNSHEIAPTSQLGQLLLNNLAPDEEAECTESVLENSEYAIWPTNKGMLFEPLLPYVQKGCGTQFVIPYPKLKPYLNTAGLKAVNELMQEYP